MSKREFILSYLIVIVRDAARQTVTRIISHRDLFIAVFVTLYFLDLYLDSVYVKVHHRGGITAEDRGNIWLW